MLGIVIAGSGISHPVWAGEKAKTVMDMAKENEKEEGTEEGEQIGRASCRERV